MLVINHESVPPSKKCQTCFVGIHFQVNYKQGVPPSEGCQTPFEEFYLFTSYRVCIGRGKPQKVVKYTNFIFQAWKVIEFNRKSL